MIPNKVVAEPAISTALRESHLPGLDALRVVAVSIVMLYHFGLEWARGGYGVVVFFVLSGFLITWLLLRELERTGSIDIADFYRWRHCAYFPPRTCTRF